MSTKFLLKNIMCCNFQTITAMHIKVYVFGMKICFWVKHICDKLEKIILTRGQFHKTLKSIVKSKSISTFIQVLVFQLVPEIKSDTFFFSYPTTKNLTSIWSSRITLIILTWIGLKLILILELILKLHEKC